MTYCPPTASPMRGFLGKLMTNSWWYTDSYLLFSRYMWFSHFSFFLRQPTSKFVSYTWRNVHRFCVGRYFSPEIIPWTSTLQNVHWQLQVLKSSDCMCISGEGDAGVFVYVIKQFAAGLLRDKMMCSPPFISVSFVKTNSHEYFTSGRITCSPPPPPPQYLNAWHYSSERFNIHSDSKASCY